MYKLTLKYGIIKLWSNSINYQYFNMTDNFNYEVKNLQSIEEISVIFLSGEITENSKDKVEKMFSDILNNKINNIILNLKDVEYMNSFVVGLFFSWNEKINQAEKKILVCKAPDHIFETINMVGLTIVMQYFPTLDEACLFFDKPLI